jgi:hypothetical protein
VLDCIECIPSTCSTNEIEYPQSTELSTPLTLHMSCADATSEKVTSASLAVVNEMLKLISRVKRKWEQYQSCIPP